MNGEDDQNTDFNELRAALEEVDEKSEIESELDDLCGEIEYKVDEWPITLFSCTVYQVHSMISIVQHSFPITIKNNSFKNNSGLRGIIYLHLEKEANVIAEISSNEFEQNAGFMFSNVIFIRATAKDFEENFNKCGGDYSELIIIVFNKN